MGSPFKRLKEVYARTYSLDTGRDADFFDCVNDIYFSPEVQSLKKYPQHDKMDRLQHITSVAYLTFRVCRHFGLDYRKAARAATMHDLFYYDWHENDWSHVHTATGTRSSPLRMRNYYAADLTEKVK